MRLLLLLFLILSAEGWLPGQEPTTRTAAIERARDAKAAALAPDEVTPLEGRLRAFKEQKYLERISAGYNGLRAKAGNMVTGVGFAIGPE